MTMLSDILPPVINGKGQGILLAHDIFFLYYSVREIGFALYFH